MLAEKGIDESQCLFYVYFLLSFLVSFFVPHPQPQSFSFAIYLTPLLFLKRDKNFTCQCAFGLL